MKHYKFYILFFTISAIASGSCKKFLDLKPIDSPTEDNFYVDEMLKYAKQNLRYDENRVYLTGLSAGGGGTWRYPSTSLANAQQFAAIARGV